MPLASRYWGDHQLNLKLTSFKADDDAQLPTLRGTVQFGRYFGEYFRLRRDGSDAAKEEERIAARVLFTWSTERSPFEGRDELQPRVWNGDGHSPAVAARPED